jgi:hypothetical protein
VSDGSWHKDILNSMFIGPVLLLLNVWRQEEQFSRCQKVLLSMKQRTNLISSGMPLAMPLVGMNIC